MDGLALHPDCPDLHVVSLCAGGRGLDRALELAIPSARTVLYVERESFAVAGLVAQIEAGLVAPAAVWSDVRTLNGRRLRGRVAGVIGGIPCQPHSLAGRRGGSDDERDLWAPRGARRIIAQARPLLVVIENVGGFLSARDDQVPGAERVRRDLQKLGYAVTGCIVRASDMGLPHERERVFVIGVADSWSLRRGEGLERDLEAEAESWSALDPASSAKMADSRCDGRRQGAGVLQSGTGQSEPASGSEVLGNTSDGQSEVGPSNDQVLRERTAHGWGAVEPAGIGANGGDCLRPDADGDDRSGSTARDTGADSGGLVDTIGGGHDGGPEGAIGRPVGRDAEQLAGAVRHEHHLLDAHGGEQASDGRDDRQERRLSQGQGGAEHRAALLGGGRPSLRPPAPGDADAWRVIAADRPDLLPALSQYDRFRIAMRDEGLAPDSSRPPAHRDLQKGSRKRAVEGGSAAWVDAGTGEPVHPARLQAAAQSALRRVADVMATRIDELRLLGNGVADAQGGLAIRIGLDDLAARGSAGAAQLVRLMERDPA